jgi:hypothetical protein
MIKVHIKAMGFADRFLPQKEGDYELQQGDSIQQLLDRFDIPKKYASVVVINDVLATHHSSLKDGDSVILSSIVGGA